MLGRFRLHRSVFCACRRLILVSTLLLLELYLSCACCPEVTVTSSSPAPFVSPCGIFNTNQRLSKLTLAQAGLPGLTCAQAATNHRLSPCALRSSAYLALGLERRRAPVPEHRLPVLGLCLRVLSACACCSEVTVTSVSLPSFVSHRGLVNTNRPHNLALRALVACSLLATWSHTPLLKAMPLVKNVVVAFVISQAIVAGGLAVGSTALLPQTMLPAAYVFCAVMWQEITMDIDDAEGDAAAGVLTLPVVLGVDVARIYSRSVQFQS